MASVVPVAWVAWEPLRLPMAPLVLAVQVEREVQAALEAREARMMRAARAEQEVWALPLALGEQAAREVPLLWVCCQRAVALALLEPVESAQRAEPSAAVEWQRPWGPQAAWERSVGVARWAPQEPVVQRGQQYQGLGVPLERRALWERRMPLERRARWKRRVAPKQKVRLVVWSW